MSDLPSGATGAGTGADENADRLTRIAAPGSSSWPDFLNEFARAEPSPRRFELPRAGDALRRIVHRLHGSPAPDEELAAAANALEQLADRLDAFPGGSLYE